MKVAIMNCMNQSKGCVAAGCFSAYNGKEKGFEGSDAQLSAFFPCGGCDMDIASDEGFRKKLDRMKRENIERVHIGNCAKGCNRVDAFVKAYEDDGFSVVLGTH